MNLLKLLSSQCGDRTEISNLNVVKHCLENPSSLEQIAGGLGSDNPALMGDCAEVMTKTAASQPEFVTPYAEQLAAVIQHPNTRVRWESLHALSLVAQLTAPTIEPLLPGLVEQYQTDSSVIVRDSIIKLAASYAGSNPEAARQAYPLLTSALSAWDGKQAALAIKGLATVATQMPDLSPEIEESIKPFLDHQKSTIRIAAKKALKSIQEPSPSD